MNEPNDVATRYAAIIDRFLSGTMPGMNHARHLAIAAVMMRLPHGRALMHLGLQTHATRAGVPQRYDREVTDRYLDALDPTLPPLDAFADVLANS